MPSRRIPSTFEVNKKLPVGVGVGILPVLDVTLLNEAYMS